MQIPAGRFMVDAHEDIACHCQEFDRDLLNSTGCDVPVMLTLPGWQAAGVRLVFATLFTPHDKPENQRRYLLQSQWEIYNEWFAQYSEEVWPIRNRGDLERLATAESASVDDRQGHPVGLVLLMEGLDLLESPAELQTWWDRGVRAASITWNGRNRFASGCAADGKGLTGLGFDLLREFERLGMVLDLAHLCDAGIADVFEQYHGKLCSTHSNSRAVVGHERNLTDRQAVEISRRNGVIGLNLLGPFIKEGWRTGHELPGLEHALAHVTHLARLVGYQHVGLGSDLDGGLIPDNTVDVINEVTDLELICAGLTESGWSSAEVAGFRGANWWRFLERCLPV